MALSETAITGLKFGAAVEGVTVAEFNEAQLERVGLHFADLAKANKREERIKKLDARPDLAAQVDAVV
jgi:hypothetical protein